MPDIPDHLTPLQVEAINNASNLFDALLQSDHDENMEYDLLDFINDDQLETLLGTLVETATSARYAFIQILLQSNILISTTEMGAKAFKPAGSFWKKVNEDGSRN